MMLTKNILKDVFIDDSKHLDIEAESSNNNKGMIHR